jgi:hypothetical protein
VAAVMTRVEKNANLILFIDLFHGGPCGCGVCRPRCQKLGR